MRKPILLLLATIGVAASHVATAQISPDAQEIIDQYIEATGGLEAKQSVKSLVQTGTWEYPEQGISGPMTVYFVAPNRMASVTEIPDVGTMRTCISDGVAWEDNSITGMRVLEDTELEQAVKDACMFPELKLSENYQKVTLGETRKDGLISVVLVDHQGLEEIWYFDPITHYIAEIERVLDAGVRGTYRIKLKTGKYLPVGDLVIAHYTETSTPAFKITTTAEKIELNAEVPEYIFRKPE